jgi:hypothetical protein
MLIEVLLYAFKPYNSVEYWCDHEWWNEQSVEANVNNFKELSQYFSGGIKETTNITGEDSRLHKPKFKTS